MWKPTLIGFLHLCGVYIVIGTYDRWFGSRPGHPSVGLIGVLFFFACIRAAREAYKQGRKDALDPGSRPLETSDVEPASWVKRVWLWCVDPLLWFFLAVIAVVLSHWAFRDFLAGGTDK